MDMMMVIMVENKLSRTVDDERNDKNDKSLGNIWWWTCDYDYDGHQGWEEVS